MIKPLPWQKNCLAEYKSKKTQKDFVIVAGTGCGKTVAGALCARETLRKSKNSLIFVAAPYRNIKTGWEETFTKLNVNAIADQIYIAKDTEAIISTYAGAASLLRFVRESFDKDIILILDEFHHLEEGNTWSDPFVDPDTFSKRLFLSGTPWRSGEKIIVEYDEDNMVVSDYLYTYGRNVNEEDSARNTVKVLFRPMMIEGRNQRRIKETQELVTPVYFNSEEMRKSDSISPLFKFSDVIELAESPGLVKLIGGAVEELDHIRKNEMSCAGGIMFVANKTAGIGVRSLMQSHFKKDALLVTSDDPMSHRNIEAFKHSSDEWIISIDMLSEGVDVPRLTVVADLSNRTTSMHIMQRWGRVLRRMRDRNGTALPSATARIHFANHAALMTVARYIETDISESYKEKTTGPPPPESVYEYLHGTQSFEERDAIFSGNIVEKDLSELADWILKTDFNGAASDNIGYSGALNLSKYMLSEGKVPDAFSLDTEDVVSEQPKLSAKEKKKAIISEYRKVIGRIAIRYLEKDFKEANKLVNEHMGISFWNKGNKTIAELERRLTSALEIEREFLPS